MFFPRHWSVIGQNPVKIHSKIANFKKNYLTSPHLTQNNQKISQNNPTTIKHNPKQPNNNRKPLKTTPSMRGTPHSAVFKGFLLLLVCLRGPGVGASRHLPEEDEGEQVANVSLFILLFVLEQ